KDELIETYWDMLESECVYNQFWAEITSPQDLEAYQSWLDTYTEGQKELGRFERPTNNRLSTVTEYMQIRGVASDEVRVVMSIGVLFLIACMVNTIGLILARFVAKSPVIALRRALGASRAQIFRQHLVEVGVVGFAGGILGLGLSYAGLAGLRMILEEAERAAQLRPELIALTIVIAVLSAMLAGLYPTWRICRVSPASFLKTQ
ncbi:MAG: FtsX-like permease family protein, partial [Pseudomonadota bacterium]